MENVVVQESKKRPINNMEVTDRTNTDWPMIKTDVQIEATGLVCSANGFNWYESFYNADEETLSRQN